MRGFILAGGEGTRLKSVTGDTPKPMAKLCGVPVIEHIIRLLRRHGITQICLALRYRPEEITDYCGMGEAWGVHLKHHIESRQLGTAGSVKACASFCDGGDVLVIAGDCACDLDLSQLIEAHRRVRPCVTMAVYETQRPLPFGTVLTDERGFVVSFTEKPSWQRVVTDRVNTGIYILSPAAVAAIPADMPYDFARDLFPTLLSHGERLLAVPLPGYWCDIGTPEAYYQCNLDALSGKLYLETQVPVSAGGDDTEDPPPEGAGERRSIDCQSRARAMRVLSQHLMEAGADFTDGIHLSTSLGSVHIAPSGCGERIHVDVTASTGERREKLWRSVAQTLADAKST